MPEASALDFRKLVGTPLSVMWVATSRCNLDCAYCLEDAVDHSEPDDASEELRELVVRELLTCRALKVHISGGEPLLLDSIPAHIARLREAGVAVRLATNGTLVDERVAHRLASSRVNVVEVSLHPGAGEAVRRATSLLVGESVRVTVRVVLTRRNRSRIHEIVSGSLNAGVDAVAFQEVVPLGRAAGAMSEQGLDAEALLEARREIEQIRAEGPRISLSFASVTLSDIEAGRPVGCGLGAEFKKSCEIRPDGNVIPCAPAKVYGARNMIAEKGLARAFQDLPALYRQFADMPLGGRCESCVEAARGCSGGCRAVSRLVTGGASAGNPLCHSFEARV